MILRLRLQKIYRYLNILDSEIILDFGNRSLLVQNDLLNDH